MSNEEKRYRYCPICATPLKKQSINGENRKACGKNSCNYIEWNNPIPVLAAIVQAGDNVVLVRALGWPEDWFGLVTGFHESGETAEDGVVREVKEELGLNCQVEGLVGVYSFFQMNQVIIAYHVLLDKGDIALDVNELVDYKKIPIKELQPWPSGTGMAVQDWLKTKGIEKEPMPFLRTKK
jgi:NADH pyrophosphatase NudC (nudix superfamily)